MRSLSIETKILHVELGPDTMLAWYLIFDRLAAKKSLSDGLFGIFLKQGVGRNENYHRALTGVILGNSVKPEKILIF